MKKQKLLIALMGLAAFTLTGCEFLNAHSTNETEKIDNTKKHLKVESFLSKTAYKINEELELNGLKIVDKSTNEEILDYKIYINDSKNSEIIKGYKFEEIGEFYLTIKKDGYEDLRIDAYRIIVSLDSYGALNVKRLPLKTKYVIGETLDLYGLVITNKDGLVIDDFKLILHNQEIREGYVFEKQGKLTITVKKENYIDTTFDVTVIDHHSIVLNHNKVKKLYKIGESLDLSELIVTDDDNQLIENYATSYEDGYVFAKPGTYEIIISYLNYDSAKFSVEVTDLSYLRVAKLPNRTVYAPGESLDFTGLVVEDENGNEINELKFYVDSALITNDFKFETEGTYQIDVTKENYYGTSFTVEVTTKSISIASLPSKLEYTVGEKFDTTGLKVVSSLTSKEISNYALSSPNGSTLKHDGTIEISISVDKMRIGKFQINVLEKNALFIKRKPTKVFYEVGDKFSLEGIIVENRRDFSKIVDFSSDFDEGTVLNTVGKRTVKITHPSFEGTSFEIEVVKKYTGSETRNLKLFSVNDTHGSLYETVENSEPGLSKVGRYLKNNKNENSLILSAGDMWQGGVESNKTRGLIMTEAMNIIGFDAMAIGNHEFDWGTPKIEANVERMMFPFLGANIIDKTYQKRVDYCEASTIFDQAGLKIGVIGAGRKDLGSSVTQSIVSGISFPDPVPFIKEESDKLRNLGCDVVVYVSHDEGFEGYSGSPTIYKEITDTSAISGKKYVDAMLFAHDHLRKSGTYYGVPYAEASSNSKNVALIDLTLQKDTSGWNVVENSGEANVLWSDSITTTPLQEIEDLKDKYLDVIGDVDEVIYNFSKGYSTVEFTEVVCFAMNWYVNDNLDKFKHKPRLATHNTGGIRNQVYAGNFTYKDLIKVFPFENALVIQKCTDNQNRSIKNNTSIRYYEDTEVTKESDGYWYNVSIIFLTDRFTQWQEECYYHYDSTGADALYEFLKSGVVELWF